MIKQVKQKAKFAYYQSATFMTLGAMALSNTAAAGEDTGTNFSTISTNIGTSISAIPGLLSGVSYLVGLLLSVLGVMKIKDHVENPSQTPLKDGAIRLTAGGALFALPILSEAMLGTVGDTGKPVGLGKVTKIKIDDAF